jgi:hypothetical protein
MDTGPVNLGLSVGGIVGLLAQFAHGSFVMALGSRKYMSLGVIFSGLIYITMGHVHEIRQFYLLYMTKILRRYFFYDRRLLSELSRCAWESLKVFIHPHTGGLGSWHYNFHL